MKKIILLLLLIPMAMFSQNINVRNFKVLTPIGMNGGINKVGWATYFEFDIQGDYSRSSPRYVKLSLYRDNTSRSNLLGTTYLTKHSGYNNLNYPNFTKQKLGMSSKKNYSTWSGSKFYLKVECGGKSKTYRYTYQARSSRYTNLILDTKNSKVKSNGNWKQFSDDNPEHKIDQNGQLELDITVYNKGTTVTSGNYKNFKVSLYLSKDKVLNKNTDPEISHFMCNTFFNGRPPRSGYYKHFIKASDLNKLSNVNDYRDPKNSGTYYIIPVVDSDNDIFEGDYEGEHDNVYGTYNRIPYDNKRKPIAFEYKPTFPRLNVSNFRIIAPEHNFSKSLYNRIIHKDKKIFFKFDIEGNYKEQTFGTEGMKFTIYENNVHDNNIIGSRTWKIDNFYMYPAGIVQYFISSQDEPYYQVRPEKKFFLKVEYQGLTKILEYIQPTYTYYELHRDYKISTSTLKSGAKCGEGVNSRYADPIISSKRHYLNGENNGTHSLQLTPRISYNGGTYDSNSRDMKLSIYLSKKDILNPFDPKDYIGTSITKFIDFNFYDNDKHVLIYPKDLEKLGVDYTSSSANGTYYLVLILNPENKVDEGIVDYRTNNVAVLPFIYENIGVNCDNSGFPSSSTNFLKTKTLSTPYNLIIRRTNGQTVYSGIVKNKTEEDKIIKNLDDCGHFYVYNNQGSRQLYINPGHCD